MNEFKKEQIKSKVKHAKQWCEDHPKETIVIVTLIGTGLGCIFRQGHRYYMAHKFNAKARSWYDPHTGATWQLRHRPSNAEYAQVLQYTRMGYPMYDALKIAGLIRR